jgi:serine/threonine protein kinase
MWAIDLTKLSMQDKIGAGSSAEVFSGLYCGTEVAVKRLYCNVWDQGQFDLYYKREAAALVRCPHPNIIRFFGATHSDSYFYIVTELCPLSLKDWIVKTKDAVRCWVTKVCQGIAQGMAFLHSKSIIHRDLKPENILLQSAQVSSINVWAAVPFTQTDQCPYDVKICDFGLSRVVKAEVANNVTCEVGTPAYMAPELMSGNPDQALSTKVDVYAFGMIAWAVWTGERPFHSMKLTPLQLAKSVEGGHRPDIPDDCPPKIKHIIEICWSADPDNRPEFNEIIQILNEDTTLPSRLSLPPIS